MTKRNILSVLFASLLVGSCSGPEVRLEKIAPYAVPQIPLEEETLTDLPDLFAPPLHLLNDTLLCLLNQQGILIFFFVMPRFRPLELCLIEVLCHHFQRLTVFLVHGEKEKRQHHCHHAKCSKTKIPAGFKQKENRNANQRTGSEAENLPFGQVHKYLGFDL